VLSYESGTARYTECIEIIVSCGCVTSSACIYSACYENTAVSSD